MKSWTEALQGRISACTTQLQLYEQEEGKKTGRAQQLKRFEDLFDETIKVYAAVVQGDNYVTELKNMTRFKLPHELSNLARGVLDVLALVVVYVVRQACEEHLEATAPGRSLFLQRLGAVRARAVLDTALNISGTTGLTTDQAAFWMIKCPPELAKLKQFSEELDKLLPDTEVEEDGI